MLNVIIKINQKLLKQYLLEKLNTLFIYRFHQKCRTIITNYIKSIDQLDPLANKEAHQMFTTEESLFTHLKGQPI